MSRNPGSCFIYLLAVVFLFCGLFACTSKKGCIDPGSISFDPDARIDDGSCTYPEYSLSPVRLVKLNSQFKEISASKFGDSRLFAITDPPGQQSIYSIDMLSGDLKEEIRVQGISAINFEALAANDTHFFIGDIGNNAGDRKDLTIYKVPKPSAYAPMVTVPSFETIRFSYPEQTDFRDNPGTDFDAESLITYGEKLYVFTKNHGNQKTSLYEIPAAQGSYAAVLRGVFDVKGVITDADINAAGNKIALIGHNENSGKAFLWILSGFEGAKFFSGKKILVDIGTLNTVGQVEGVSFYDDNTLFITNEDAHGVDAALYYLDISSVQ